MASIALFSSHENISYKEYLQAIISYNKKLNWSLVKKN